MQRFYLLFALALFQTACGGGGGSGGGRQAVPAFAFNVPEYSKSATDTEVTEQTLPTSDSMPPEYTQTEYTNNTNKDGLNHLTTIKANYAYAQGLSGKGITLGIVDRPIDLNHPEFCGSDDPLIDPNCKKGINYDHKSLFGGMDGFDEGIYHGTAVASVMAGAWNRASADFQPGYGMMGVAYNANLMVFGVNITIDAEATGNQDPPDMPTTPIDELREQDGNLARIFRALNKINLPAVNLSFGIEYSVHEYGDGSDNDEDAGRAALERHFSQSLAALRLNPSTVYVYAAGNSTKDSPSVTTAYPAYIPELQNRTLVVVNDTAHTDGISNKCGIAKAFCLAAPGKNIVTARNDDSYPPSSGTSFAAPQVTGAIALLLESYDDQSMTSLQAAARLLATADDEFVGYDINTHGQGRLDIEAALAPAGTTSLIAGNGALSPLASTTLTLPAAFGDALQHTSHTLTFFDSLKTAFLTPLTNHLTFRRTLTLDTLLQQPSLTLTNNKQPNPYFALLNQPSLTHTLPTPHKNLRIALSAVKPANNQQQNKWGVSLRHKPTDNLTTDVGYSDEGNHMLGSHGSQALEFQPQHTLYGNLNARYALSPDTHLQATAFISQSTSKPQPHSIIRALSPIISTAFDVRLTRKRVLNNNDQLRWRVHQPLKVEHGAMTLHYATWRNATQLLYGTQTLDLTPSSRALHFGVDYETPFIAHIPRSTLTLSAAYVKDPNHSHYDKNTWLAALRLHMPF